MNADTFDKLRTLVYEKSGITLGDNKQALVRARIAKRMRQLEIVDYDEYLHYVMKEPSGDEIQCMVDAISTNVTSFYREPAHFDFLREAITGWIEKGVRDLHFWSAASSTGEEPYTMAIETLETIGRRPVTAKILGTDISRRVLETAQRAEYTPGQIKPVPEHLRDFYFERRKIKGETRYAAREALRAMVVFRQFNLSAFPYPLSSTLDAIFCRNVMIYFDRIVRTSMVHEFQRLLKKGGYLFVGHAESITGLSDSFMCIKPSVYKRV
ncbi:MAG: protein-glutamate O-methyltransferase CheR [candidate division Zixibacteria bacterium]|nr:protein-glutamate O-methyltransferase CheR [candidate division Zixibacteria bacterium]